MCKKTWAGPTQTRKKVLPPTREHSFSKITKPGKSTKVHPKWPQRRTLDPLKTHIEGALADGFHHIVALRPQAQEKCAKLCEKCPGKVPWAPKHKKKQKKCTNIHKKCPRNLQNDGKCPGMWAFLRNTKKPKENASPTNGRHSPHTNNIKKSRKAPPPPV